MSQSRLLRQVPRLTVLLMVGPVLAGMAGTVWPAFGGGPDAPFVRLFDWAGFWPSLRLSVVTGVASTLLALILALAITMVVVPTVWLSSTVMTPSSTA